MRPILHSPRILRTGEPLTLEAIKEHCPAVFAEGAHPSRGPRYRYVPTIVPLLKMFAHGWGVYEAAQAKPRNDSVSFTKHMLRMRKLEDFSTNNLQARDGVPEVVLINAHNGGSAYHLKAGFFRFICSNGMMVGKTLAGFTVRHTVGPSTAEEVLEAGERTVTEKFPIMIGHIDAMKTRQLTNEEKMMLAMRALDLRYGQVLPCFPAEDLLVVHRPEDEGDDLWTKMNVIQENVLNGGWETTHFGRKATVRPTENVSVMAHINSGLWDKAMEFVA